MGVNMGTSIRKLSRVFKQTAWGLSILAIANIVACQAPPPVNNHSGLKGTAVTTGQGEATKNDPVAQNNAVNTIDAVTAGLEALKALVKAQNEQNAKDLEDLKAALATLRDQMEKSLLEIKIQSAKDRQAMLGQLLGLFTNLEAELMSLRSDVIALAARQTALESKLDAVKAELIAANAASAAQLVADYTSKITGVQNVSASNLAIAKQAILLVIAEKEKAAADALAAFRVEADKKYATINAMTALQTEFAASLAGLQTALNQTNVNVANLTESTAVRFTLMKSIVDGVKSDLSGVSNLVNFLQSSLTSYMKATDDALAAVNANFSSFKDTYAADHLATQANLLALQNQADDFKKFMVLATGQLSDLARNYASLSQQQKDDYKKISDAIALIQKADKELNDKIAGLQGDIIALQARMAAVELLAQENSKRIEKLGGNLATLGATLAEVQADMKRYAAELGALSQKVDSLAKDMLAVLPAVSALESKFTDLARQVAKLAPNFLSNAVIAAAAMCDNGDTADNKATLARTLETTYGTDVEQAKNATASFYRVALATVTMLTGRLEPVSNTPYSQSLNERFKRDLQSVCGTSFVYDLFASTYYGTEYFSLIATEAVLAILMGDRSGVAGHDAFFQGTKTAYNTFAPLTQALILQNLPSYIVGDDACAKKVKALVSELFYSESSGDGKAFRTQLASTAMATQYKNLLAEAVSLQAAVAPVNTKTKAFWAANFSKLDDSLSTKCLTRQDQFASSAAVSFYESIVRENARASVNDEFERNISLLRSVAQASSDITVLQKFTQQESLLRQELAKVVAKQGQDIQTLTNNAIFTYKLIAMLAMRMGPENMDIATAAAQASTLLGGTWTLADAITPKFYAVSHRYGWSLNNSPLRICNGNTTLPGPLGLLNGLQYAVCAIHYMFALGNTDNAAVQSGSSYYVNGWYAKTFVWGTGSVKNGQQMAQLTYNDSNPSSPEVQNALNMTRLKEGDVPSSFPASDPRSTFSGLVLRIVGQNLTKMTVDVMNDLAPQAGGSFVAHSQYPWDPIYNFVPSAADPSMNNYPYFNRTVLNNMSVWQVNNVSAAQTGSMVYDVLIKDISPLLGCTNPFRAILRAKYKDTNGVDKEVSIQHRIHKFSPIVLSFGDEMIQTVHPFLSNVNFDLDGDGLPNKTGWISRKDGFLAVDRNGNGKIDDGTELFGEATILHSGVRAANGYAAMADLDENHDGYLDEHDGMFRKLVVWFDRNQDGISQPSELFKLSDLGITRLSVKYDNVAESKKIQSAGMPEGNWVVYKSKFFGPEVCGKDGCSSYDVYFGNSETSPIVEVAKAR